jgi:hypothetical protein
MPQDQEPVKAAEPASPAIRMGCLCALVVIGAGFSASLVYGIVKAGSSCIYGQRSKGWSAAPGRVIDSYVVFDYVEPTGRMRGGPVAVYQPIVKYTFDAGGVNRYGDTIDFIPSQSSPNKKWAYARAERYPKGAVVTVYFDPNNPRRCTLEVGIPWKSVLAVVGGSLVYGLFACTAFCLIYFFK